MQKEYKGSKEKMQILKYGKVVYLSINQQTKVIATKFCSAGIYMRLLAGNVHADLDGKNSFHESKYAMQKPYAMLQLWTKGAAWTWGTTHPLGYYTYYLEILQILQLGKQTWNLCKNNSLIFFLVKKATFL